MTFLVRFCSIYTCLFLTLTSLGRENQYNQIFNNLNNINNNLNNINNNLNNIKNNLNNIKKELK
jgi:hypothetical protein